MFNVGGGELLVIVFVAFLVLGPSRLPGAARQVGKALAEFRRISGGLEKELRGALDHDEFRQGADALREVGALGTSIRSQLNSVATSMLDTAKDSADTATAVMASPFTVVPAGVETTETPVLTGSTQVVPPPDGLFEDDRQVVAIGGTWVPVPQSGIADVLLKHSGPEIQSATGTEIASAGGAVSVEH